MERLQGAEQVTEAGLADLDSSLTQWRDLCKVLADVPDRSHHCFSSHYRFPFHFYQDLITFMVTNSNEAERQRAYQHLNSIFSLVGSWERYIMCIIIRVRQPMFIFVFIFCFRFRLLGSLLQDCPYAAISGLMVARLKNETLRAWPDLRRTDDPVRPPFASPKLMDLFPHLMNTARPIEQVTLHRHLLSS